MRQYYPGQTMAENAVRALAFTLMVLMIYGCPDNDESDGLSDSNSIYVINTDGSGEVLLTDHDFDDRSPQFSPDGSKIAFRSYRDNENGIYTVNPNGSELTKLIATGGYDFAFSPDGRQIVYSLWSEGIRIVDVEGTEDFMLVPKDSNHYSIHSPRFSPNGAKVVFVASSYRGNDVIKLINVDGTGEVQLTDGSDWVLDERPQFTPDSSRIVFLRSFQGDQDLYIMDVNGSNQIKLTDVYNCWNFDIFPDGSRIVLEVKSGQDMDVFVIDVDGSNKVKLTESTANDHSPEFSPDGTKVVFVSDRDGDMDIYIMNIDGTEKFNVTNNERWDDAPRFSPDGKQIVFESFHEYYE